MNRKGEPSLGHGEPQGWLMHDLQEKERMAVTMLKQRMNNIVVATLTGLSADEVSRLKADLGSA